MPLNRPALALGEGPRDVALARRWVMDVCSAIDRPELTECARLGVSELVTNALMHGQAPIEVRVRGTQQYPRVEVRDGSTEPPELPHADHNAALLTFGRGLGIVARAATAWGAEIESDGKVVWFVPATELREQFIQGVITGGPQWPAVRSPQPDDLQVSILGVPPGLYREFLQHNRELRREVRLLALANESDYPLAKNLSDTFDVIEHDMREGLGGQALEDALGGTQTEPADVSIGVAPATAALVARFIEMLEVADAFCRDERLLSLARSEQQERFQRWLLGEFVRQCDGEPPLAWHDAAVDDHRRTR
ncbi:ATP-binding protein [Nocardioides sp.]|uniref:ATP-binding protein n=1 Tax=Nocardioides sp. TaxID=35761 RepID=UPI00356AD705